MSEIGICTNLGECKIADKKIKITLSSNEDKVCPGCKGKLYILDGVQISSKFVYIFTTAMIISLASAAFAYSVFWKPKDIDRVKVDAVTTTVSIAPLADDYDYITEKKKVQIGVQGNSPPFNFVDSGKRVGLDLEIARLIFNQEEFSISKKESIVNDQEVASYAEIPSLLNVKKSNGEFAVDIVMGGLTFEDDEKNGIQYSIPYIDGFGYSLISKQKGAISSEADLKGKKIGVTKGDVDVITFVKDSYPNSKIVELSDGEITWIVDSINTGVVDAVIYDYPFAGPAIKNSNLEIVIAKLKDHNLSYKIGVRSTSKKLISKLNSSIQKVRQLPVYEQLIEKYLYAGVNIAAPVLTAGKKIHMVIKGETLSIIARDRLGSLDRVDEIVRLNNLPNPNFISINSKLIMPVDYK